MENKIWFITGISSGLGKALAEAVLEKGDFVVGTFRHGAQVEAFNAQYPGRALGLRLDVTSDGDIERALETIRSRFGRLDVLVNNAGFGFAGAIEEAGTEEVREVFEANFFGALRITQAALPLFRGQRSGHIVQVSSHGGFKAFPALAFTVPQVCPRRLQRGAGRRSKPAGDSGDHRRAGSVPDGFRRNLFPAGPEPD